MNDYERKQAEELAAQKYPHSRMDVNANLRKAFIEGYEAALETVAPEEPKLDPKPHVMRNEPMEDWRHSYLPVCDYEPTCHFEPREGYSQNREDYR